MLARRNTARPFAAHHITLLQHLAAQAVVAVENARAFNELQARNREVAQALEQQTATADILDVISRAPSDLQAALDAVVLKAARLIDSDTAIVMRFAPDGSLSFVAVARDGAIRPGPRLVTPTPAPENTSLTALMTRGRSVMRHGGPEALRTEAPRLAEIWETSGINSSIVTLLTTTRGNFGALVVARSSPDAYTEAQIRLFETFADQAVIAIENARLFDELQDSNTELAASVEREAALARISQRINEHPLDVDGTLVAVAEAARLLTGGDGARVFLVEGDELVPGQGSIGDSPAVYVDNAFRVPLSSPSPAARAFRERRSIAVDDVLEIAPEPTRLGLLATRMRSNMAAPLGRTGQIAGSIAVVRSEVRPFTAAEMATLEAFAAQAAIAIETARAQRLLVERNAALAKGLERETATADILRIISQSPGDIEQVVATIGQAARRLCEGDVAAIVFKDDVDEWHVWDHLRGHWTDTSGAWPDSLPTTTESFAGTVDSWANAYPVPAATARRDGLTEAAVLLAPMLGMGGPFGMIGVRRSTARPFSPEHVSLLERFAAQAVIAIENARVFNELQARNKEITEALRREEASSDILRQISRAPEQLDETLQAIADAARRLTGATVGLSILEGEFRVLRGMSTMPDFPSPAIEVGMLVPLSARFRRAAQSRQTILRNPAALSEADDDQERWLETGVVTIAIIPVTRGDEVLGFLGIASTNDDIAPATIALLQSFADQAAIAMENARLIRELRESNQIVSENLDRQQVLGNVLSIIASAPADLDATLPKIAEAAMQLCDAETGIVAHVDGQTLRRWGSQYKHRRIISV